MRRRLHERELWRKEVRDIMERGSADEKLKKECQQYFRQRPVFGRLLRGFREKYRSYGKFAGTVILKNLKESERDDLEGFLLRNYHGKKSASVSAELFERAMAESRFAGLTGKDVLELYFQEPVQGKKEQRQQEERQWTELLSRVKAENAQAGGMSMQWISEMQMQGGGEDEKEECVPEYDAAYRPSEEFSAYLKKRYRESGKDFTEAERLLGLGIRILDGLSAGKMAARVSDSRVGERENERTEEKKYIRYLAVFAAEITGNPHAFDDGTKDGKYLELLVKWYVQHINPDNASGSFEKETETGDIAEAAGAHKRAGKGNREFLTYKEFPAYRKQRLYLRAGILRDDVSNYALAAGIRAENRDGKLHAGMEGFFEEGEPVQIPLSVIAGWKSAFCPGNKMYIVENPSVYAVLCGKWEKNCGLMCMNGQPRFSSLLLLELLAESGAEVWYAGDIDPEGLLIAQRLKRYYRGKFHFWHMSAEDYEICISGEELSQRRLRMLDRVDEPELRDTAELVKQKGKAGYQENMLNCYDIRA